jgi:hypothetical protein
VDPIQQLDAVDGIYVLHPRDDANSGHVWVRVGEENERTAWDVADILRERLDGLRVQLKDRGLDLDVSVMLDDGSGRLRPLLRLPAWAARSD